MNQTWGTHLQSKLQQLHEREQYRNLHVTEQAEETWLIRDEKRMLNLASNNYLGLAGDERLKRSCYRMYKKIWNWGDSIKARGRKLFTV